jgi:ectoine hydroxylase
MDETSLQHLLSDEERKHFNEQGFLVVENALSADRVACLTAALDRLDAEKRRSGLGPADNLFFPNFIGRDSLFIDLVDCPTVFPKVCGILGWNIYLYHSHCGVNPPAPPEMDRTKKTLGWHQDSGRVNLEMESHPRPRLSLKVAYFLSDCSEPGRGNFSIIPGSHLSDTLDVPTDGVSDPAGSIPVCARPGTAVFFDRRLWHAGSPNWSDVARKVLFLGYGYRWIRTKDDMTIPEAVMEASDPIRRQILGAGVNCNGRFSPTDADVPLKGWFQANGLA